MPLYDEVNEAISFRRASRARTYAVRKLLENRRPQLILDSGAGPGNMSVILLQQDADADLVALDYSTELLEICRERLAGYRDRVHLVRGCFEDLPFKSRSFDAAVTAYALRDSPDLKKAIAEYARSIKNEGRLVVVDLAKPDNRIKRFFAIIYVRFIAPLVAKLIISGRLKGNPWRAIPLTYHNLPTTRELLKMFETRFEVLEKREWLSGGMLVILLRSLGRSPSSSSSSARS
jgi:demethylmenaquinone methyltransferase/2-methoxy-6-polyprenyl-1,4-benzoquinol methylase